MMMRRMVWMMSLLWLLAMPAWAAESQMAITTDQGLTDKWYYLRTQDMPQIDAVRQVLQGQSFMPVLFFANPGIDANGLAHVHYDLKMQDSQGKTVFEKNGLTAIDGKTEQLKIIRMSRDLAKVSLQDDPVGKYVLSMTVVDNVAKTRQIHQQSIELRAYEDNNYFATPLEQAEWMSRYYAHPTPEKAIDGLLHFADQDGKEISKGFASVVGFYGQVFNENSYLIPLLLEKYPQQKESGKRVILSLLPYLQQDVKAFVAALPEEERNYYQKSQSAYLPRPTNEIVTDGLTLRDVWRVPMQMDMLWGSFYADGSYRPIRQLVGLLNVGAAKGALERYKFSRNPQDEQAAARDLIYQAAKWSLGSNIQQHQLVRGYCEYIYEREALPEQVKAELKMLLGH